MVRVMLVDDHQVVRDGLAMLLANEDGIEVVGSFGSGRVAVSECDRLRPDVVVMDLSMPELDGTRATRLIRERLPQTQVLVLTSYLEEDLLHDALEAGACGYLLKSIGKDELTAALRAAARGEPTVDPAALPLLLKARGRQRLGDDLTTRELDVLALLVSGMTNQEISDDLGIGPGTVRAHVSSILAKLGVSNRTEAAVTAMQHGLVTLTDDES
jgi:two-component system, NarL family, response regulator LiaR